MAKTYTVQALGVRRQDDACLAQVVRQAPEGATQTFLAGWPLKAAAGLLLEWVTVADELLAGFAMEDATGTTSKLIDFVPALPHSDLEVEGNILVTATNATYNLLAADLFVNRTLEKGANLLGTSLPGWFIGNTATAAALQTCAFESNQAVPTDASSIPGVGDTDARIRAKLLTSACYFGAVS